MKRLLLSWYLFVLKSVSSTNRLGCSTVSCKVIIFSRGKEKDRHNLEFILLAVEGSLILCRKQG